MEGKLGNKRFSPIKFMKKKKRSRPKNVEKIGGIKKNLEIEKKLLEQQEKNPKKEVEVLQTNPKLIKKSDPIPIERKRKRIKFGSKSVKVGKSLEICEDDLPYQRVDEAEISVSMKNNGESIPLEDDISEVKNNSDKSVLVYHCNEALSMIDKMKRELYKLNLMTDEEVLKTIRSGRIEDKFCSLVNSVECVIFQKVRTVEGKELHVKKVNNVFRVQEVHGKRRRRSIRYDVDGEDMIEKLKKMRNSRKAFDVDDDNICLDPIEISQINDEEERIKRLEEKRHQEKYEKYKNIVIKKKDINLDNLYVPDAFLEDDELEERNKEYERKRKENENIKKVTKTVPKIIEIREVDCNKGKGNERDIKDVVHNGFGNEIDLVNFNTPDPTISDDDEDDIDDMY